MAADVLLPNGLCARLAQRAGCALQQWCMVPGKQAPADSSSPVAFCNICLTVSGREAA